MKAPKPGKCRAVTGKGKACNNAPQGGPVLEAAHFAQGSSPPNPLVTGDMSLIVAGSGRTERDSVGWGRLCRPPYRFVGMMGVLDLVPRFVPY